MTSAAIGPRALAGVAVYTMFRGDAAQLLQWCNFHLNAGAEALYVVLDRPDDALLAMLPDDPRVTFEAMDAATWDRFYSAGNGNVERRQVDAFRHVARRAQGEGHEFLAFVDTDELIWLNVPLREIAAAAPDAAVFTVPVREMWYAEGASTADPFGATLALCRSTDPHIDWTAALGWRAQFLRNGLLGHQAGKSIYRLPLVGGDLTVHRPRTGALADKVIDVPLDRGAVLHFDAGSVGTWNARWVSRFDGGTVATGLGPQRRAQQALFAHELRRSASEQVRFFGEFFSIGEVGQGLLEAAGVLSRVEVGALVSGPLAVPASSVALGSIAPLGRRVDFQFALACDRRFVKPTFATMASVVSKMGGLGSIRFVVLGDGLGVEDVVWLRRLQHTGFDVEVVVHDVTSDLDRDVGREDPKRTTFGRIYLVDYLPQQRTIYLDGDVLATREFSELFSRDLGQACFAGVPDSAALRLVAEPAGVPLAQRNRLMGITGGQPLDYLNGGVLIFDMEHPDYRRLALEARALVVQYGRALTQRDQDAMNMAFSGRKHRLESVYNYMTQFYVSDRVLDGDLPRLKYAAADATLVHFSGKVKPWESAEDEFYNGLYRRLVAEAEEVVGVSCGFYFSKPAATTTGWSAERWTEALAPAPAPQAVGGPDLELVDLSDHVAHLRVGSAMYALATSTPLRLALQAGGTTLAEAPLSALGGPRHDLDERVGPGVRALPFDLAAALEPLGGVVRGAELLLVDGPADSGRFRRSLAVIDVLAAGRAASPELLGDLGADGALERLEDGRLTGWIRTRHPKDAPAVSLWIDGELAASRVADLARADIGPRARGFTFDLARLLALGYGTGADVSVRVAGTNIMLRGAPLSVVEPGQELRYDPDRQLWVKGAGAARKLARRVRGRVARLRVRGGADTAVR